MIILVGPSGSGKTVTALELAKKYNLSKAITTTTRPMRKDEVNGRDYFFVSKKEFERKQKNNELVESSLYNNNWYGCGIDQVTDNKIVVLDPNGVKSFKKLSNKNIKTFLLSCSEQTRYERMKKRGDDESKIKERLSNDLLNFSIEKIGQVDFVINTENKDIDEICKEIYSTYLLSIKNTI